MALKCPNCGCGGDDCLELMFQADTWVGWRCSVCNHTWEQEIRKDVVFRECARCGKFDVLPDEWVDLCPMCLFWQNM